jgi:broad specificity phosphatase PhoE
METVLAVARVANADVETTPLLLEQSEEETGRRFMGRVTEFCDWWLSSAPGFTIVCSHGDWIPVAVERLTGARARLDKGSWTQITVTAGKVRLEYLIQGFLQKKKEATGKITRSRS